MVEGKAIRLHPLVCAAFNADFDGDQMAVHVPLSFEAQIEARLLMLASNNVLKPADGEPVIMDNPQDILLGSYYLTKVRFSEAAETEYRFASAQEALSAYESGRITLHQPVKVRIDGELLDTTAGRIIFNEVLPEQIDFINREVAKDDIKEITSEVHRQLGNRRTAEFVDQLKKLGVPLQHRRRYFHSLRRCGRTQREKRPDRRRPERCGEGAGTVHQWHHHRW